MKEKKLLSQCNLVICLLLLSVIVLFASVVILFRRTRQLQGSLTAETSQENPQQFNSLKYEHARVTYEHEQMIKKIEEMKTTFLVQMPEFRAELETKTIQSVFPIETKPGEVDAWVLYATDTEYIDGLVPSDSKPNHFYIATPSYWKDLDGARAIECSIGGVQLVRDTLTQEIKNFLISEACSIAPATSLYEYATGNKIPLTDPRRLIPSAENYILTDDGSASGFVSEPVFGENPIFEVSFGHAEPYAKAIFSAMTGKLLDLTLYSTFTSVSNR